MYYSNEPHARGKFHHFECCVVGNNIELENKVYGTPPAGFTLCSYCARDLDKMADTTVAKSPSGEIRPYRPDPLNGINLHPPSPVRNALYGTPLEHGAIRRIFTREQLAAYITTRNGCS